MSISLYSPYKNTILDGIVLLQPYQMDNNIYLNILSNVKTYYIGKCYNNFGYIIDVIKLENITGGLITHENRDGAAEFVVKIHCKICNPLINTFMIFKIDNINKQCIKISNGPIIGIIEITTDKVNQEIFVKDNNNNLRYKNNQELVLLSVNDYIIANIMAVRTKNNYKYIETICKLQNIDNTYHNNEEYYMNFNEEVTTNNDVD